jgi:hypothetical protein
MKRKTFADIIHEEFRWPTVGDKPFVEADDPLENANIGGSDTTRLVLMMEGYRKGADIMVDYASAHRADRDFLVCPIIFNYRQFLELSLKYMLAAFGRHVDVKPNWNSHDLTILWKDFAIMLERFGTEDPDNADPIVAEVVGQFSKIDPGSYSHRYPVDKKGEALPLALTDLHLPTLKDVMNAVSNYFSGCDGYLDHLVGSQP